MATEPEPIRTDEEHAAAMAEVERLWGARCGTPEGERLDVPATLIDAYQAKRYPMGTPGPIDSA